MDMITLGDVTLHYRDEGDPNGAPIVFVNSLGTDFRLWNRIIPLLPEGLRILRFDKRGHGLSSCPQGHYTMSALVDETAQLIRELEFENCLFIGLSIGGLIAQGLAAQHPSLIKSMVISNSAAGIGTPEMWQERIDMLQAGGIEALADTIMELWVDWASWQKFSKDWTMTLPIPSWSVGFQKIFAPIVVKNYRAGVICSHVHHWRDISVAVQRLPIAISPRARLK